jgi:16S rRNA (adenine1518-N6/adenine1519-N6)-dimethyltransferase
VSRSVQHIPRKRFGQHFLTDAAIIDGIVRAIHPRAGEPMVEIGPGLAALTQPLVERLGHLTVIELDRDLAAQLRHHPQLTVVESDVLRVNFTALAHACLPRDADLNPVQALASPSIRVVGNLPYNISSPILFHLLDHSAVIRDQHFMLQDEVVERMIGHPSTPAYGRLSVMMQWRYEQEKVLFVPPESFDPPPRVDSSVVRMIPRAGVDLSLRPTLEALVQVAFSQRRKILRNTLGQWLHTRQFDGHFDVQRRAEEVAVEEYVALAHAVRAKNAVPLPA